MIEEVFSIELPVGERLSIKKNRIQGNTENNRRIAIVSGIHGDEFEGQYICYEVARRLLENIDMLTGTVDIYPALNPLGLDMAERNV
ncbi:MAG: succinylglutamate desuccinylase/aspartoacylase family protein, partial [Lachnospiraceae bacterium]|nr:succinylglutamate desuccinylase/aspartoacylase family protein [Lachnospiraceae bacterium]